MISKSRLLIVLILISSVFAGISIAQEGEFEAGEKQIIECTSFVDDRMEILDDNDIAMIESFIDIASSHAKINVFILILPELPENYEITISQEMHDYLTTRGLEPSRTMIIVIVPDENHVQFVNESFIDENLSGDDQNKLKQLLLESIDADDLVYGLTTLIDRLPRMPSLEPVIIAEKEARKEREVEWIEFEKRFDDRAGILTQDELDRIERVALQQEQELGIKAFLLIVPLIEEWDFQGFGTKQFRYWQSQGHVDSKSYLILISHNNQKLEIVRGSYISFRDNDYEIRLLRNRLHADLRDNKYADGIIGMIEGMNTMPGLVDLIHTEEQIKQRATWFMLIGILILIAVFLRMGLKRRMEVQRLEERRSKNNPFYKD